MNNYEWDETTLGSLRIHELRDLARKIGVKCPTAKKKEDLISQSMQILKGEAQPYVAPSKKGRPNKSTSQVKSLVEFFMPEDLEIASDIEYKPYDSIDLFAGMPAAEYGCNEIEQVSGLVEINNNGFGIIRVNDFETSDKDVFIHEMFVGKYNLKSGDYVVANAKEVMADRPRSVTNIISVNDNMPNTASEQHIVVGNKQFEKGNNVLYLDAEHNALKEFELLNNGVNIYVSAYDKNVHTSTDTKIYVTTSPFKLYKDIYCCYNMAFNRAKVLAKTNTVTISINSLGAYYRALEGVLCDKIDTQVKLDKVVQEEILKTLESLKNNGITLVIYDTLDCEPQIKNFLNYELKFIVDYCETK